MMWDNTCDCVEIYKAYWERSQTSKMKLFVKIANCFESLTILAKSTILDLLLSSDYASESYKKVIIMKT